MKKTFFSLSVAALLLGLCACESRQSADTGQGAANNLSSETNQDWAGTYTGLIPSGSGPGIAVTITLRNDLTYEVLYKYMDRPDGDFTFSGNFKWDKDAGLITLDGTDIPPHYRVGENKLTQLDLEGKTITGAMADDYVLRKQ